MTQLDWARDKYILIPTFGFVALMVALCFPESAIYIGFGLVMFVVIWAMSRAEKYGVDGFLIRYQGKSLATRLMACTLLLIGASLCIIMGVPVDGVSK